MNPIIKNCSYCNKVILKDNNYFYDHSFKDINIFCNDDCLQDYCKEYCEDYGQEDHDDWRQDLD